MSEPPLPDPSGTDLDQQARAWLVRLHSGRADPDDYRKANRWRHQSDQHARAYQRAERLWTLLGDLGERATLVDPVPLPRHRRGRSRALAASMLVALIVVPALLPWRVWTADLRTAVGEVRRVPLADGSVLTLNADSAVNLRLSGPRRRVILLRGEALFQVAQDQQRPFLVEAGDARIRVTGTAFDVERGDDGEVRLIVAQGSVAALDNEHRLHLHANQQVRWRQGRLGDPAPIDAHQALAWRRGHLVFQDRPLAAVVDDLARYHPQRLILLGDELRQQRVSGVFDTAHPDRALTAIAASLAIDLHRFPGLVVIY